SQKQLPALQQAVGAQLDDAVNLDKIVDKSLALFSGVMSIPDKIQKTAQSLLEIRLERLDGSKDRQIKAWYQARFDELFKLVAESGGPVGEILKVLPPAVFTAAKTLGRDPPDLVIQLTRLVLFIRTKIKAIAEVAIM